MFKRQFKLPFVRTVEKTVSSLSLLGKVVFYIIAIIFVGSALRMLWKVNQAFLVEVPARGGSLTEGVIGLPRFINPVLTVTDGDKDLAALVYSGLMKYSDGALVPDLAEKYDVSSDGKVYTFTLRKDAVFQDNTPVTVDDVIYTIEKIQDPALKSPKRISWQGVTVKKTGDNEIQFILEQAYAPFLENTTIGILPKAKWQGLEGEAFMASDLNMNPIGSGPYKISNIARNDNGVPTSYELVPFQKHVGGSSYISKLIFKFYTSEKNVTDAYSNGDVDSINSISPEVAFDLQQKGANIVQASLPRVFAVFFNQDSNKALADVNVRKALSLSVNRDFIINSVLQGFADPLDSAVPKSFTKEVQSSTTTTAYSIDDAAKLLDSNGWVLNTQGIREKKIGKDTIPLAFSISTSDSGELKQVAEVLKSEWKKIGADVTVKVVESGNLNQNIIKPRKYEGLLFGQVINRDFDLYPFWHSSQQQDPGLNVAMYSNKAADKILENLRIMTDKVAREQEYLLLSKELQNDMPAVFLYTPRFIYIVPSNLHGLDISEISAPSERFGNISSWYTVTDHIWKIFLPNK